MRPSFPTPQGLQSVRHPSKFPPRKECEGCLVVRSGHGPQAEVAQTFGPGPLVEL